MNVDGDDRTNNTSKLYSNIRLIRDLKIICLPMEYYLGIKRNEIMPFAATWMDLEMIILSEVSQTEKDKYHLISLTCGI